MLRRALSFDRKKKSSADDATAAPSNGAETARPRTGSHEPVIVSMRRSLSFGRRESLPTNWRRARCCGLQLPRAERRLASGL